MSNGIDVWGLFIALLTTAILQEFIIKPSVEKIKEYYHKSKKFVRDSIDAYPSNEK